MRDIMIEITCPFCGIGHFVTLAERDYNAWQGGEHRKLFLIYQQQRENSLSLRSAQSAKRAFLAERTTNKSSFFL